MVKFKDRSDKGLDPLKLAEDIKNKMESVLNAKMMLNVNVLVLWKSEAHREKARKVCHFLNIECFMLEGCMQNVKGVIYVIPDMNESTIVSNLQEAEVEAARRFTDGVHGSAANI